MEKTSKIPQVDVPDVFFYTITSESSGGILLLGLWHGWGQSVGHVQLLWCTGVPREMWGQVAGFWDQLLEGLLGILDLASWFEETTLIVQVLVVVTFLGAGFMQMEVFWRGLGQTETWPLLGWNGHLTDRHPIDLRFFNFGMPGSFFTSVVAFLGLLLLRSCAWQHGLLALAFLESLDIYGLWLLVGVASLPRKQWFPASQLMFIVI